VFYLPSKSAAVFDLRTVDPDDDPKLARAIRYAREER
jgi:hypothetical protein